jgi:hypothetical protein
MNSSCNKQTHVLADVCGVIKKQMGLNEEAISRNETVALKQIQMLSLSTFIRKRQRHFIQCFRRLFTKFLNPKGSSLIPGQSI